MRLHAMDKTSECNAISQFVNKSFRVVWTVEQEVLS